MSKLYINYLELKKKNNEKIYLFKSGIFYIFIDDDAKNISNVIPLKLTKLTNNIVKCGFPVSALERYINVFKNLNLDVELINEISGTNNSVDKVLNKIKSIDIDNITPLMALNMIKEIKDTINE